MTETKLLHHKGNEWQLTFKRVYSPAGLRYFIYAIDTFGKKEVFEMKKNDTKGWRMLSPSPSWAMENEYVLVSMVEGLERDYS